MIKVFISHSSADSDLARGFVELLLGSISISRDEIRCTSLPGFRHSFGSHTSTTLRDNLRDAKIVVGLLTPESVKSNWVLFELGASWGSGKWTVPIVCGIPMSMVPGPLSESNAAPGSSGADVASLVEDLQQMFGRRSHGAADFQQRLSRFVDQVNELATEPDESHEEHDGDDDSLSFEESVERLREILDSASVPALRGFLRTHGDSSGGSERDLVDRIVSLHGELPEYVLENVFTQNELRELCDSYYVSERGTPEELAARLME